MKNLVILLVSLCLLVSCVDEPLSTDIKGTVTAEQLGQTFEDNPYSGKELYAGQLYYVKGTIEGIYTNRHVRIGGYDDISVTAIMNISDSELATLKVGDEITVLGRIDTLIGGYLEPRTINIHDCVLK